MWLEFDTKEENERACKELASLGYCLASPSRRSCLVHPRSRSANNVTTSTGLMPNTPEIMSIWRTGVRRHRGRQLCSRNPGKRRDISATPPRPRSPKKCVLAASIGLAPAATPLGTSSPTDANVTNVLGPHPPRPAPPACGWRSRLRAAPMPDRRESWLPHWD